MRRKSGEEFVYGEGGENGLHFDPSLSMKGDDTHESLTDRYGIAVFTNVYEQRVHQADRQEHTFMQDTVCALFTTERLDVGLSEWEQIRQSIFLCRNNGIGKIMQDDYVKISDMGSEKYVWSVILFSVILLYVRIRARYSRRKRSLYETDDYDNE